MTLGIDASNIKAGGGLTHLKELIEHADPQESGIEKVIIWGGDNLSRIPDRTWLEKNRQRMLTKNFIYQSLWKIFVLPKLVSTCDILFVPGGTYSNRKVPYVSMSQNMLVFEAKERNRFPFFFRTRYIILNYLQTKSFSKADGVVFISHYAKKYISSIINSRKEIPSTVIYHGISKDFSNFPKPQRSIHTYSAENPFRILYVSVINFYKHQWNVVKAIHFLREKGYYIELILIGPANKKALSLLEKEMKEKTDYIKYPGKKDYTEISMYYKEADMFLFASTCENMPNILVEAMSAGLPVASSDYGPMPEILKDAGEYFDPTDPEKISEAVEKLLLDPELRQQLASKAFENSKSFTWEKCAKETFDFISHTYKKRMLSSKG